MKKKMLLLTILCTTLFSCAKDELMPSDREDGKIEIKTVVVSEGGIITKAETAAGKTTGGGLYATGENCVVKAIPNLGYTLDKFEGSNKKKTFTGSDTYDFPVEMTTTFSASFKKTESPGFYNLKVNDPSLGSVQSKVEFNTKDWENNDGVSRTVVAPIQMNAGVKVVGVLVETDWDSSLHVMPGYALDFSGAMENSYVGYFTLANINQNKAITFFNGMARDLADCEQIFYDLPQDVEKAQDWYTIASQFKNFYSLPSGTTFTIVLSNSSTPTPPKPSANSTITLKTDCPQGQVSLDGVTWGKSVSITVPNGTNVGLHASSHSNTSTEGNAFIGFDGVWQNNYTTSDNGGEVHTTTSGSWSYVANGNITINATFQYQRWSGVFDGM